MVLFGSGNSVRADDIFHKIGQGAGNALSGLGKAAGDGVKAAGQFGGQAVNAGGQVVGGAVGTVAPEAGNAIKDGGRRLGNNIEEGAKKAADGVTHVTHEAGNQVEENPIGTLIALIYPPAAPFVLGAPTIGQAIACSISEHLKSKETCNVQGTLSSLSTTPVATLGEVDMDIAPLTTLFKCLGIEGWLNTGCEGVGSGRPVREAQHSQDGFWTIDLSLDDFEIQGQHSGIGRFLRLEVRPNRPAHSVASQHVFTASDRICFGGPIVIDKGKWLEVHPIADFGICPPAVTSAANPGANSNSPNVPAGSAPGTGKEDSGGSGAPQRAQDNRESSIHQVRKGECLSRIAKEYYGKQVWVRIFRANRNQIKDPDLIYPGQLFTIPK